MKVMVSSWKYPLMGKIAVDETVVGQQEEGVVGCQNNRKKQVVLAIEKKGKNFPELHRIIMMFKAWLRGIHHSVDNLQAYIDQYCYRFNRSQMKGEIFDNLLTKMVDHQPCPYKCIRIY